jgi:hypothetical protein
LRHREEAEKFYRELAAQGVKVRVGIEASGHARWFERLLAELHLPQKRAPLYARPTVVETISPEGASIVEITPEKTKPQNLRPS